MLWDLHWVPRTSAFLDGGHCTVSSYNMDLRCLKLLKIELGMVVHAFNPSTWEAEAGRSPEFEASLVYKASSRIARAVRHRKPV